MRIALIAAAALAAAGLAAPAVAHPNGHDDEYRPQRRPIPEVAQEAVVRLVSQAKLPASWSRAKLVKSELRTRDGIRHWLVTFRNPAERNPAKRMLYVIVSPEGSFLSANHRLT